jgi:hypothetical protein
VGQQAALDILTEDVAEQAAEVFVAGVAEEATAVGEHAHEAGEQTCVGQGVHLRRHALELIVEPPAAAELHLAGGLAVLEVADHRGEQVVLRRVDVVQDRLGQFLPAGQRAEVGAQADGLRIVADRIEARVRPEILPGPRVVVADGAEVKLLGPAGFVIQLAEQRHHVNGEPVTVFGINLVAVAGGLEDLLRFLLRAGDGGQVGQAMVAEARAHGVEEGVAGAEGVGQAVELVTLDAGGRAELIEVRIPHLGVGQVVGLVGAEGGVDGGVGVRRLVTQRLVVFQRVGRVVGGADEGHIEPLQDRGHVHLGDLPIGLVPDLLRGVFIERLVDVEVPLQLQRRPVVERIAQGVRDRPRPGHELVIRLGIAGAELLVHPVGAHGPPLVVVACQPEVIQVVKGAVGGQVLGGQVAVVVVDGHRLGVVVVELARHIAGQQEVIVDEAHGSTVRLPGVRDRRASISEGRVCDECAAMVRARR